MNRKITECALAERCATLAASGFAALCCPIIEANASPPKPQNASRMNSRRVRVSWICPSFHIQKGIQVEDRQCKLFSANAELALRIFQKLNRLCSLRFVRRTPCRQTIGSFNRPQRVAGALPFQPLRKRFGGFVRKLSIEHFEGLRWMGTGFAPGATGEQRRSVK